MKRRVLLAIAFFAALVLGGSWAYFIIREPHEAALEILAKLDSTYANCKSLRDRIDITTTDDSGGKKQTKRWVATFAFERPASLRYEFRSIESGIPKLVSLLCASSQKATHSFGGLDTPLQHRKTWCADISCERNGKPYVSRDGDLTGNVFYLLSATEFTISDMVGLVLPQEIGGMQFRSAADSRLVGSEKVEGLDCFVLESRQLQERLWIDKKSYVLRKSFEWDPSWRVCIMHPELNASLDPSVFKLATTVNDSLRR